MDPITILELVETAVSTFIKVEPIIAQGIKDFKPFAIALYEKFTGQVISEDERTELEARIDAMHSEFQALTPPDDVNTIATQTIDADHPNAHVEDQVGLDPSHPNAA